MPEQAWLTLSQLAGLIRLEIEEWSSRTGDVLVVAEVSEIRRSPGGHWFIGLVERRDEGIVAEMRAVVWQRQSSVLERFRSATGSPVAAGMELLLRGRVGFHERYGLRFDIADIDPTYTLGEMQRKRREVIERLRREGLLERNKRVRFVEVPQRVAVVSSEMAAGYGDFLRHLHDNPYGYAFAVRLYPALMQGDGAEVSVAGALGRIAAAGPFDVAVVIRGGGSQVDLSCFDTYGIAAAIANLPLPVITGLGHERDETVADMVAHTRAKTPTAAAEAILARVRAYEERMEEAWARISALSMQQMETANRRHALVTSRFGIAASDAIGAERTRLEGVVRRTVGAVPRLVRQHESGLAGATRSLWMLASDAISVERSHLEGVVRRTAGAVPRLVRRHETGLAGVTRSLWRLGTAGLRDVRPRFVTLAALLKQRSRTVLQREDMRLGGLQRELAHLDPASILRRGFSITRFEGKALVSDEGLLLGDEIETLLADGKIMSRVYGVGGSHEKG